LLLNTNAIMTNSFYTQSIRQRRENRSDQPRTPKPPQDDGNLEEQIARINELAKTARSTWLSLLGYLAFIGVTVLAVRDVDFFIATRQTQLPIIGVSIPTASFFLIAPNLGAALYIYLHLHLMKLWEAIIDATQNSFDEPLSDKLSPWLITDFGLWMRQNGALRKRCLIWLSVGVVLVLVFAMGPALFGFFWLRYWPAHNGFGSLFILAGFLIAVALLAVLTWVKSGAPFWIEFELPFPFSVASADFSQQNLTPRPDNWFSCNVARQKFNK
jgi:hypothetical protein